MEEPAGGEGWGAGAEGRLLPGTAEVGGSGATCFEPRGAPTAGDGGITRG